MAADKPWDPITQPCDYIRLKGQKSPGLAEVVGAGSPRKWEERDGYGFSGSILIYRGRGLASFSVRLRLYTTEHWAEWHQWKSLVSRPPPRVRARAMDIWHPLLEDLDIKSVVVEDVLQGDQIGDGEWQFEIKFKEYRPLQIALAKPDSAQATPVDPVDQKMDELVNQIGKLANG